MACLDTSMLAFISAVCQLASTANVSVIFATTPVVAILLPEERQAALTTVFIRRYRERAPLGSTFCNALVSLVSFSFAAPFSLTMLKLAYLALSAGCKRGWDPSGQ